MRSIHTAFAAGALACLLGSPGVDATGLGQLKAFLDGTKTAQGTFRQSVASKTRTQPQDSGGTFAFARPGKFRWTYEKPFEQLIVGDGENLWVFDRDLNQVIVRKLDVALGSTPAALLAGDSALEKNFDLTDAGGGDGLAWVEAKPRSPDTGFQRVKIGFADNLPKTMELRDTFGNVTMLTFGRFERNPAIDPAQFKFVPPKGADVVGETK